MDMPGFGIADKPEDFDYSVPGYARHLAKLLTERGVRRAHLVMHDFGGPWGLAWAANNPQAVASVTCINTGVLSGHRWHYLAPHLTDADPRRTVHGFHDQSGNAPAAAPRKSARATIRILRPRLPNL
jgi:pimeloyl-ACP methyl ester carboxylesterase